jgi:histidyl-tRNA synthetase
MASRIQAVRGMNDILPEEARRWELFEDAVRDWLHAYGYRNIRLPIVEHTELFVRSIGEVTDIVEKEMYSFEDQLNGESLTLRPEGTASCVRSVSEHNLLYNGAQRLYYQGPMFRHERPQKGRYRQFHQVGVEALGCPGPDVDAEHILMCARLWRTLGVSDVTLELNTLGSSETRLRYRARLVEYLKAHENTLDVDSKRRVLSNPLRVLDSKNPAMQELIEQAPRMMEDMDNESITHFETVQKYVGEAGIKFRLNHRLVRGLDYYNRTVFEWVGGDGAQSTVCAGGRYDGLIEQIGAKPAPACGFAIGVERVLALMAAPVAARAPDIYVVHQGAAADGYAFQAAEQLRDLGLAVVFDLSGASFKAQMKRADGSGALYAVVVGDDEAQARVVSLKPLRETAEQRRLTVAEAGRIIAQALNRAPPKN